jgi:hypothetical protein
MAVGEMVKNSGEWWKLETLVVIYLNEKLMLSTSGAVLTQALGMQQWMTLAEVLTQVIVPWVDSFLSLKNVINLFKEKLCVYNCAFLGKIFSLSTDSQKGIWSQRSEES